MIYVQKRQQGKAKGDTHGREAHKYYLGRLEEMRAGAKVANPHRFVATELADGTQTQLDALQAYFDDWADNGEMYCRCELDNELIESEDQIVSSLEMGHVTNCEPEMNPFSQGIVDEGTTMVIRGIDCRKIELHHGTLSTDPERLHRIPDYGAFVFGGSDTSVEMAELLTLESLHKLADKWEEEPLLDIHGEVITADLTIIDKGWMGSWTEDGEKKTWLDRPIERFCMERPGGWRRWLPAKGQPNYRKPPKPDRNQIVGDNWHINVRRGKDANMTELIWNAEHWHAMVQDLFVRDDDVQRFELFAALRKAVKGSDGIYVNHRTLAEHMRQGAEDLAELRRKAGSTKKPKRRRDHLWDAFAMALLGQSVELHMREHQAKKKPKKSLADMAKEAR